MSGRRNSSNLRGVQVTESSKNRCLKNAKQILWTTSVTFPCSKSFVVTSKSKCQVKVTAFWFGYQLSRGRGELGMSVVLLQSQSIWIDAEEESTTSSNWFGCNFKPFRGHTYLTSQKMANFVHSHNPSIDENEQLLKNKRIYKHVANFKTPPHSPSMSTS